MDGGHPVPGKPEGSLGHWNLARRFHRIFVALKCKRVHRVPVASETATTKDKDMSKENIITGPLGVVIIITQCFDGRVEREVRWKRGYSSLVFAANQGRLEIAHRLLKDSDADGYISLPNVLQHWLQKMENTLR